MIIYFTNIKKEYFSKVIFSGARLKLPIEKGEKIGVVAKNGEGKTTLLRMIAKLEGMEGGNIKIEPKKSKVFYLSVDHINESKLSTEEFLLSLNSYLYKLRGEVISAQKDLSNDEKLKKYGELVDKYENQGGYIWEEKVRKILEHLNIHDKNLNQLSGGEKSRVILAGIQIIDADLVLLDEPTNHLDITRLEELEEFIKHDHKSYIIISHDQKFLDNIVTKILSIQNMKLKLYDGNYSAYKTLRELEEKQQMEEYLKTQKEINRLEKYEKEIRDRVENGRVIAQNSVNANKKGKRLVSAQGKKYKIASDNDKSSAHFFNQRTESVGHTAKIVKRKIRRIEKVDKPKKDWGIKVNLQEQDTPDIILHTENMSFKYDEKKEFFFPDLEIYRGEKTAIVGPNGTGKSTFAKIIVGLIKKYNGEFRIPDSVSIGYYSQTHESLDFSRNVLENLLDIEKIDDYDVPAIKEARNYLHQFLFSGDMVLQKVADLSQGEKSKLALAKIIFQNPTFLLLDEPTNHLDIPSKERLEEALANYSGAMLVISHDRYFMESIGITKYVDFT